MSLAAGDPKRERDYPVHRYVPADEMQAADIGMSEELGEIEVLRED